MLPVFSKFPTFQLFFRCSRFNVPVFDVAIFPQLSPLEAGIQIIRDTILALF
jgi:hypothetical protein